MSAHVQAVARELSGPLKTTSYGSEATVRFDPLVKANAGTAEFRALLQRDFKTSARALPASDFEKLLQREFKPNWQQPKVSRFGMTRGALPVAGWAGVLTLVIGGVIQGLGPKLFGTPDADPKRAPTVKEDIDVMADVLKAAQKEIERLPQRIDGSVLKRKRERGQSRIKIHGYSRRAHS
jgi:hypothetical protein